MSVAPFRKEECQCLGVITQLCELEHLYFPLNICIVVIGQRKAYLAEGILGLSVYQYYQEVSSYGVDAGQ